jgi:hypothetical protein
MPKAPHIETDEDAITDLLQWYERRNWMVKAAGGVSWLDVSKGTAVKPDGWVADQFTCYYVPPNLLLLLDEEGHA